MMKRVLCTLLCAALLCACAAVTDEPVFEPDVRAEQTEAPVVTEAPVTPETVEATQAPTDAPEVQVESYADRVTAAWKAEGLLDDFTPYSDGDMLDLYGIDTAACISLAGFAETVGYTCEIVLVEADEATAAEVKTLLDEHLTAMKAQFRGYDADAEALVDAAVLQQNGGVVLMIVSPNADALVRVLSEVAR